MANIAFLQSTARSGTTWLGKKIGSHPEVSYYGEFLFPNFEEKRFYTHFIREIEADPINLVPPNSVYSMRRYLDNVEGQDPAKVAILDLKLEQITQYPTWATEAYMRQARYIILHRANLLKQVVSEVIMYSPAGYINSDRTPDKYVVAVDPENVLMRMRAKSRLHVEGIRRVKARSLPHIFMTYEEMLERPADDPFDEIQEFLGLAHSPITVDLKKQNPFPLEEIVENYAELRAAVRASEFDYTLYLPE